VLLLPCSSCRPQTWERHDPRSTSGLLRSVSSRAHSGAETCNAAVLAAGYLHRIKRRYRNPRKSSYDNLSGMAIAADVASGLFALGGVALAGAWAEIRAGREARARQSSELFSLKRELYTEAIVRSEAVASSVAQWVSATEDDVSGQAVWVALTSAYETVAKIRIVGETQVPADAMQKVLAEYRTALESNDRRLPKPRDLRHTMIREFRKDLGRPTGDRPDTA
jgi:hypothetical protein